MRTRLIPLVLAAAAAPLAPDLRAEAEMLRTGGVLGNPVTFDFQGDPGQIWGFAFSPTTGPTPLVLFDPNDFRILSVGFELIHLWQFGLLDGAGQGSLTLPLPASVTLAGIPFHSQMVTMFGAVTIVDEISDPNAFVMSLSASSVLSLPVMPEDLDLHTASSLPNGDVLIAGGTVDQGINFFAVDKYWVYGAQTAMLTELPTQMTEPRTQHTATVLADGRILTLGGTDEQGVTRKTGEIFDPATMTATPITPMSIERVMHSATLLPDGRVFVAGGAAVVDVSQPLLFLDAVLRTTEIYDLATDAWTPGPNMPKPRALHAGSRLGDGRVLLTGGLEITTIFSIDLPEISNTALRYDAGSGTFLATASFAGRRGVHGQMTLPNGDALIAGGADSDLLLQDFHGLSSCAIYHHLSNTWTTAGSLAKARAFPELVLHEGTIYALGGTEAFSITILAGGPVWEIESTTTSVPAWSTVTTTAYGRDQPRAAVFDAGTRILITGAAELVGGPDFTADIFLP